MKDAKLIVTIDIFSGRENPVVEFTGKELQNIMERLAPIHKLEKRELGLPPIPTLGYRGMVVDQVGLPMKELPESFRVANGKAFGRGVAYIIADDTFEDFVCGTVPKELPIEDFRKEFQRFKEMQEFWVKWRWEDFIWPRKDKCKCAPIYEPTWWNVPARQYSNNCYNYACNYRTDSFAQPGYAVGEQYSSIDCNAVTAAAVKDMLVSGSRASNECPKEGHLVALVVASNGWDYHWYRKGRNGYWSHKPGPGAVTDLDNSGNLISDPRTADRGFYDEFCTFMFVHHGHIKIDGPYG